MLTALAPDPAAVAHEAPEGDYGIRMRGGVRPIGAAGQANAGEAAGPAVDPFGAAFVASASGCHGRAYP